MYCWHCGEQLTEEARFCPVCGMAVLHPLGDAVAVDATGQQVHSLLAQANLLRLRKDWQSATMRCSEALRIFPTSAATHSLLGDICRDEGRLRDAMEWYKLALSLDPTRRADREKLDSLIDEIYGAGGKAATAGEIVAIPPEVQPRDWPGLFLRYGAMALGAAFFVLMAAFVLSNPIIRSEAPGVIALRRAAAPEETTTADSTNPEDTAAATAPTGNEPVAVNPTPAGEIKPPGGSAAPQASNDREPRLLQSLSDFAPRLGVEAATLGVVLDPRSESAEISFAAPPLETVEETRARLLELSLRLGKEAAQRDRELKLITLRAQLSITNDQGVGNEAAFAGQAPADRLRSANLEQLSPEAALQLFSDYWWSPDLAQ